MARGTKNKKKNSGTKFPQDRLVGPTGMTYVVNGEILDEHVTNEEADELLRTNPLFLEEMVREYKAYLVDVCRLPTRSLARSLALTHARSFARHARGRPRTTGWRRGKGG